MLCAMKTRLVHGLSIFFLYAAVPGYTQTYVVIDQTGLLGSTTTTTASTPVSHSSSGTGEGYGGASWTADVDATPGVLTIALHGSGNPNPYNGAYVSAKMIANATFTDAGSAPSVSVSLNTILNGVFTEIGAWQTDFVVRVRINNGAIHLSGVRRNYISPSVLGTQMGSITGSTVGNQTFVSNLSLVTPSVTVPTFTAVPIEIHIESSNTLSDGASSTNNTDFTYHLPIGSAVFNLGAGVNVQIPDWNVVNNQFAPIPEPATTALLAGLGMLGAAAVIRRRNFARS
jgi:hypothetical protein